MTNKELIDALDEVLNKKRSIDDETHTSHHHFIQSEVERRERRHKLWLKFETSIVAGLATGLIAVILWIGSVVIAQLKG